MNKFYKVSSFLSLLFLSLLSSFSALGDGSRDLYPDGAIGYRAFLSANTNTFNMWPFPNPGIHYVYAQEGETITLASSAQGITNARIRLFAPNGTQVVDDGIQGKINNRTDEKNGPRLRGVIDGVGYTPIYYNVRETGIYRVEFLAHRSTAQSVTVLADSDWIQRTMDSGIAAWDVSVINTANSDFIKGRVYTNALNFSNGRFVDSTFNPQDDGFYGIVYVLTKAGYIYRVNNNGNNGVLFILFANNNGFVDAATQEPIYKSLNTIEGLGQRVHNPNSADTDKHITHKMFYTVPSFDLPTSGIGAVPGGYTWLKNAVITPDVSGVKLIGVDGSESQFSAKGGYIRFEAGEGQYSIKIESAETPNKFSQRILTGSSIAGENSIFWDGRAGDTTDTTQSGLPLPEGNIPLKVTVELKTAEIHFPFIDIDYNQFGIKVELLDPETLANTRSEIVKSDIVYWNDIDIPNVLNGSSSNPKNNSHLIGNGLSSGGHDGTTPNGHIWGVNGSGTSGLFGNNNAIDTWTFVKGKPGTLSTQLNVKEADLKVISITTNRSLVKVGEEIIFTVVVGNDGPSDVEKAPFAFNARMGFDITNVAYTSSCVKAEQEAVITDNVYKSKLDLDNGCEIIYEFTVKPTATAKYGLIEVDATIMRPNDVTDPDATNPDLLKSPIDPYYEIEQNGFDGRSNNFKVHAESILLGRLTASKSVNINPLAVIRGDTITYSITINNSNSIDIPRVSVFDTLTAGIIDITNISTPGSYSKGAHSITWNELTIPANGSVELVFDATVDPHLALGTVSIKNTATISEYGYPNDPLVVQVDIPVSEISLVKNAVFNDENGDDLVQAGERITYTYTVKNNGGANLTSITITDSLVTVTGGPISLASAEEDSSTFSASYIITQEDIDAGGIYNLATVGGEDAKGNWVTAISNDSNPLDPSDPDYDPTCPNCTFTKLKQVADLTFVKLFSLATDNNNNGVADKDDVVTYTFTVENTGTVTLSNLSIIDDLMGLGSITYTWPREIGTLLPEEVVTATADYTITQADVEAGKVENIAIVEVVTPPKAPNVPFTESGSDPKIPGKPNIPGVPVEVDVNQVPEITVTKTTDRNQTYNRVGDVIEYMITITNTGNVTLSNVVVIDDHADVTEVGTIATLDVGERKIFTANHTVTQADVDSGVVYSIAAATAKDPKGRNVSGRSTDHNPSDPNDPDNPDTDPTCPDCTIVPIEQVGTINIFKTTDRNRTYNSVGDLIEYTIIIENTGNVTLADVVVIDDNADITEVGTIATLAVGERRTFTVNHTVTQADIDAGVVYNIAAATAKDPKGREVTGRSTDHNPLDPNDPDNPATDPSCPDCTLVTIKQEGSLKLTKTTKAGIYSQLGQVIDYELILSNTGNVTIKNIVIKDQNDFLASITPAIINELYVGESVNIMAKYTITQNDLDMGYVYTMAEAMGKDPKEKDVSVKSTDETPMDPEAPVGPNCPSCTITPVSLTASITLVKAVTNTGSGTKGLFHLADKIEYSFTITNTGGKTLKDIVLFDPLLNRGTIPISGTLAPGKSIVHKEFYEITAKDVQMGKVTNSAVVVAKDPQDNKVKDTSGSNADNDDPTVTVIGKGPKALDDEGETLQNTPITIDVMENDEEGSADLDLGSIRITLGPEYGTVAIHNDGTVTYMPDDGYVGKDVFTYTIKDKNGMESDEAIVSLVVKVTMPVAMDDRVEMEFNKEVKIWVLNNDKGNGAELDPATIVITERARNGTVLVNADGTVTYRPHAGYTGDDHFSYTVKDANGNETSVADVDIKVTGFFIPNVFTPNGDGNNDVFEIVGLDQYDRAEITIFNRWGNEVYRNRDYKNNWDGSNLNEGTYYYLISLNKEGRQNVHKGWVLLKR